MKQIDFMPCEFCPEGCKNYKPMLEILKSGYLGCVPIVEKVRLLCNHEKSCAMRHNDESVNVGTINVSVSIDGACVEAAAKQLLEKAKITTGIIY